MQAPNQGSALDDDLKYTFLSRACSPRFPDHHQLSLILDTLGTPSIDDFYAINSQRSREYIRALPFRKKKNFASMFPNANPLVRSCDSSSRYVRIPRNLTLCYWYLGYRFDGKVSRLQPEEAIRCFRRTSASVSIG